MKIERLEFNLFGENTYILYDPSTMEAVVVDPGMMNRSEEVAFDRFVSRLGLKLKYLINTHLHIDHVAGDKYISQKYGLPLLASADDEFLAAQIEQQAKMFRLNDKVENVVIEKHIGDGDRIYLGEEPLEILAVPGHSPGSLALYAPNSGFVVTGDALFLGSIGRTDLPGGNFTTLINSITRQLLTLPEDTIVYPGHGSPTTIKNEKNQNPFLCR